MQPLLNFGEALEWLKKGEKVSRLGWNGQGMFAYLVEEAFYPANTKHAKAYFGELVPYRAYLALKTAQEDVACWSPSGSDVLAEDWLVLWD